MANRHRAFLGRWPVLAVAIAAGLGGSGCKDDRAPVDRAPADGVPEGAPRSDVTGSSATGSEPRDNGARGAGNETVSLDRPLDNPLENPLENPTSPDPSCTGGFERVQRLGTGSPEAQDMFARMTLDEKRTLLSGYLDYEWTDGTAFEAAGVERVDYPTFRMRDGARGVRGIFGEPDRKSVV